MKLLFILSVVIILSSFKLATTTEDEDLNKCVEKYKATWGDPCMDCTYNKDIFQVFFRNTCTDNLDIMIAVQEVNKKWNCFFVEDFKPQDTVVTHACKGTGKYLYWVRKAGDRELVFPTCEEINSSYKN